MAGGHGSPDASGALPGHRHTPGCWAVAKSGIPPREPLFNATICRFPGQWGAEASARAFSFGEDGGVVPLEVRAVLCLDAAMRMLCLTSWESDGTVALPTTRPN